MPSKKRVLIGFLGSVLDARGGVRERWKTWRPSVCVCRFPELPIDRFELLVPAQDQHLADRVSNDINAVSSRTAVRQTQVSFKDLWDLEEVFGILHEFARGYVFDLDTEEYLLHITTGTHVAQICLFLLAESRHFPARLIQTSPPTKRHSGEAGAYRIIDLNLARYDRLASRFRAEQREALSVLKCGIATRNTVFNELIERIERVALASSDPMLLMGPTGAGKSQLARRIYELRKSRHLLKGAFVEVNCATIRGDAAMSALFGHVKGAFTGAIQSRPGLLRMADEGLLLLDEVGELGLDEQAMLLRAIEEKAFLPVGSDRESRSDFQLIAGTNRDLLTEVQAGRFRADLLARINVWTFRLPGLKYRVEDIEPNLQYELDRFATRMGRRVTFNREALDRFLAFACHPSAEWRGNFRDLAAVVTRLATLADGARITVGQLDAEFSRLLEEWSLPEARSADGPEAFLEPILGTERVVQLDRFDLVQLAEVVRMCRAARSASEAGRMLFAASRGKKTRPNDSDRLRKYLGRFGLTWDQVR